MIGWERDSMTTDSTKAGSDEAAAGSGKHRNDIYADDTAARTEGQPAIPAATVVVLRPGVDDPLEVLMLKRVATGTFAGMWVFPGGRIDPEDFPADGDVHVAARNAAVRETQEEAGIEVAAEQFVWFAHWTPPASTPKRFTTWFFAAPAQADRVRVDGAEIEHHAWVSPTTALAQHAEGAIDLAPPTWVTLWHLARYSEISAALTGLAAAGPRIYETRIARRADGVRVALWSGDAGYDAADADAIGPRHRLVMMPGGFVFEDSTLG
jgi:8-oxo-dGTP pyrophosphatase MutT (NUDIX family)